MKRFKMSGSSCYRWLKCPASILLSEQAPKEPPSAAAKQGTAAHTLIEMAIKENKHPKHRLFTEIDGIEVTQEMVDGAMLYINTLNTIRKELKAEVKDIVVEQTLELEEGDVGGTCDAYIIKGNNLVLVDYKFGLLPVEVEHNKQLLFYTALILQHHKKDIDNVRLVIVQPRAFHENGTVRGFSVGKDYLENWSREISDAIHRIRQKSTLLVLGNHCEYCPAINTCPEMQKQTLALAKLEFSIKDMSPGWVADILDKRDAIGKFMKSITMAATKMAESGIKVPRYKLVKKRSHRQWGNKEDVIQKFIDKFGEKIFEEKELLSPAKLEKIVGRKQVAEMIKPKDETQLTLVEESDSRQACLPFEDFKGPVA